MITADEENYKEAVEASYKLFSPQGTGKHLFEFFDVSETHSFLPALV